MKLNRILLHLIFNIMSLLTHALLTIKTIKKTRLYEILMDMNVNRRIHNFTWKNRKLLHKKCKSGSGINEL